jgi:ABC-type phosphate/phosphonate transport system substrate-binding protein
MARLPVFVAASLAGVVALSAWAGDPTGQPTVLHIGSSGALSGGKGVKEDAAVKTLQVFISEETNLPNDIQRQKNWQELVAKMVKGDLQLGVLQGYEFAWAKEKYPKLQALALAVNVYPYPVAYIVENKKGSGSSFAGLKGRSLALPAPDLPCVRLFLESECKEQGARPKSYFSKIEAPDNSEDALDEVVDGKVDAAAVDRAALEGYKRRKPGRFGQLKPVVHSEPFPPTLVAYYDAKIDETTLQRFRDGLVNAGKKEKGQMMLTLFRLTRFDPVPADFGKLLAETRKRYPASLDAGD